MFCYGSIRESRQVHGLLYAWNLSVYWVSVASRRFVLPFLGVRGLLSAVGCARFQYVGVSNLQIFSTVTELSRRNCHDGAHRIGSTVRAVLCIIHIIWGVERVVHVFFFISNSIFQLSLELLNTVFNIAENPRGPLLQIGVQTSFQSEFFHLAKETFENPVNFSSFC